MTSSEFAEQVYRLIGKSADAPRAILKAPVYVMVNNAEYHRPSTAVIEFEDLPPFTLVVSHLRAPYARRTLVVGRLVLRDGDASATKRQLCELIDAFLDSLGVTRDKSMAVPLWGTVTASKTSLRGG